MAERGGSRVKSMFSKLAVVGLGSIRERVVGPVHQRVLAEHGSHDWGLCDGNVNRSK
jgi:hypothetical protein